MQELRLLNENRTYQNMYLERTMGKRVDEVNARKDILELDRGWKEIGMSPTVVSDMLKVIFGSLLNLGK